MDIAEVNPRELVPFVGSLGVGVMDSMAFSLSSRSNSTIDENQISFGTVDFLLHPPTLVSILANLDQEMDMMFGRLGSVGRKHRSRENFGIFGWLFQRGNLADQHQAYGKHGKSRISTRRTSIQL
jgi:hypothetical protein